MRSMRVEERGGWYYAYWTESGKTRKKSLKTKDQRAAKQRANRLKREILAGRVVPIAQRSGRLKDFRIEFLEKIENSRRPGTYRLYDRALTCAIESWGDIPLSHITTRHIDGFVADCLRRGLSRATANCRYRHLKAALRKAVEWDLRPPLKKWPKELRTEKRDRRIPETDLRKIFAECESQDFTDFMMVALYTGLRSGEILRLTGQDVDRPRGYLRVSAEQKNLEESVVPMAEAIAGILRARANGKERLFPFRDQTDISHRFKALVRKAGVNDSIRFHDLRHTYGSSLAMKGWSSLQIKELMRHKAIASTMKYMHLSPSNLKEAVDGLNFGPLPMARKK